MSPNVLADVPPQHNFSVCDGRVLRNLQELQGALVKMGDNIYSYHANDKKNDFANWVNDIFKEPKLAQRLRNASKRQDAIKAVASILNAAKRK